VTRIRREYQHPRLWHYLGKLPGFRF
jgi:hypothetical protein